MFFDRGLVDAASALQHMTGEPALETLARPHPYHRRVFLTPPWPEIYGTDPERRHGLDAAIAEYERLLQDYPALGYEVVVLPKVSVAERAEFVLATPGGVAISAAGCGRRRARPPAAFCAARRRHRHRRGLAPTPAWDGPA